MTVDILPGTIVDQSKIDYFFTMDCCDICGAQFALRKNLLRHIVYSHHDNEPSPMQKCDQCNYTGTFTNLNAQNL